MTKIEFLDELYERLAGVPQEDRERSLAYYGEMIDDHIEEGLTEEEAVSEIGSAKEIASQIIAEPPFSKIAKENIAPKRRLTAWEIVLLALGSPIWLSLLIAAFVVVFSVYVVLWSIIISLWAADAALALGALGIMVSGTGSAASGSVLTGITLIAAALVCAGLSIFLFFGCREATKGIGLLSKKMALGIKGCFVRKGKAS